GGPPEWAWRQHLPAAPAPRPLGWTPARKDHGGNPALRRARSPLLLTPAAGPPPSACAAPTPPRVVPRTKRSWRQSGSSASACCPTAEAGRGPSRPPASALTHVLVDALSRPERQVDVAAGVHPASVRRQRIPPGHHVALCVHEAD